MMGCYFRTWEKILVSGFPTEQNYSLGVFLSFWIHLGCQVCGHRNVMFLYVFVNSRKIKVIRIQLWIKRASWKILHLIIHYEDVIMKSITVAYVAAPSRHVLSRGPIVLLVRSCCALYPLLLPHCWPWHFQVPGTCGLFNKNVQPHCQLLDYPYWVLISVTNRDNARWIPVLFFPGLGEEMFVVPFLSSCPSIVPIEGDAQKSRATEHVHGTFMTGLVPWYLVTIVFN